jgi:biopolymer transport protein ExbD
MGYPEPKRATNSNLLTAIAILAIAGLCLLGVLFGLRFAMFRSATATISPPVMHHSMVAVAEHSQRTWTSHDLVVEVDQQGQVYFRGQPLPLEQIRPQLEEAMRHVSTSGETIIHVEEGCPFEHVEKVIAMYKELGMGNPRLGTVPPHRTVTVTLDEQGKAEIDGEPTENVQHELQQIANRHGARAKVEIEAHPQCPSEFVVKIAQYCRDAGILDVQAASIREQMAEKTP